MGGKQKQFVKSSTLLILAFATAFFSRLVDSVGAPSVINFIHFATIPVASFYVIIISQPRNPRQIRAAEASLFSLLIFFCSIITSAIVNDAGIINAILSYLLWVEAYFFLCSVISVPLGIDSFLSLKTWISRLSIFHIGLALVQKVLLDVGLMRTGTMDILQDNIQGVFYLSGGGHVVGASVSISFAIYCFGQSKMSLWLKVLVFMAAMTQLVVADAKQVLLVAFLAWIFLILTKVGDLKKVIIYVLLALVSIAVLLWCMQNLEAFRGFNTWVRPEIYGSEGEATLLKSSSIRIITSHHENVFNWLFGLGPGHTVDRLGGWMLPKYSSLLAPLGATVHPASAEVWSAIYASWLGGKSSMFSPLFGWAGLWGDLGVVGLVTYFFVLWIVWSKICIDDVSKFLLLTICVNGLIFSQMQEPGFTLYIALLIGIRFQEKLNHQEEKAASKIGS